MSLPKDRKIKQVYDRIAGGFYHLRQQPITPYVKKLADEWKSGLLLDVGCGIGNSMLPFARRGFKCVGIDISPEQIKYARKFSRKHGVKFNLKTGSITRLPFRRNKFDYVISVAVIHHLDTKKKRMEAISEMKRVLKTNGKMFVTVWNKHQIRFLNSKKDVYVPWKHKGKVYRRYYHLFSKKELKGLFYETKLKLINIFEDENKKNICLIAVK